MMIKLFLLLIWLVILPTVVGCLWTRKTPEYSGNLLASYFYGLFTVFALFEVLAVPMVFLCYAGCGAGECCCWQYFLL